jgi:hypothetical protein
MYGGEKRNAYMVLVRRPEGKRHLGRSRHRWGDNINMNLKYDDRAWTESLWVRIWTGGRLL